LDPALRQTLRQQRETLATQVREGTQFAEQAAQRITWSEGQLSAQRTALMQAQQRLSAMPPVIGDRTFLQQALSEATNVLDRVDSLQQQIAVQQTTKQNYEQQIANNIEIAKKATRAKELQALIARAQALVHHQAAPRFVAQRKLETLQQVLNELLATMNAEYRVTAEDGLSFIAHFPDGRHQAAERLSYGQSTILVLCFRLALHVTCVPDLSLLVLDEPTAYLDADHIRGFEQAIDRLREYAASRGLQVVIVTHEATLAPLFDATIRLGRVAAAIPPPATHFVTQGAETRRFASAAPNVTAIPRQG
jgi:DNA repair exonuclease SbcCD ATPase subunit